MPDLTFRDFAGAVMQGNDARAAEVLRELLGVSPDQATASTAHFRAQMANPQFMTKAMGLRTAVQSGTDDEIAALLSECFALPMDARMASVAALRARYPKT